MDSAGTKKEHIHSILHYIENNLTLEMNTEQLLEMGFVSHTQLYRDFYSITGHSVKEYIRKRRLSNALALIKSSAFSLADIAYECGYSSQQALCRIVKNAVHMTPKEYKNSDEYFFFPPNTQGTSHQITVGFKTIPRTIGLQFFDSSQIGIENKAVKHLLYLCPDFNGRIFGKNAKQEGFNFCYELYMTDYEGELDALASSGFRISYVKEAFQATFACVTVPNKEEQINAAWDSLYTHWLSRSMFEAAKEPYFEEYLLKNGKPNKLKLFLPIQKRSEHTKITVEKVPSMRFFVALAKGVHAEQISAAAVFDYLSTHYPNMLKTSKLFYMQKEPNTCTSGVMVNADIPYIEDFMISDFCLEEGVYATLHNNVIGDYARECHLLLSWVHDNALTMRHTQVFAVYDVTDGYGSPKVKLYCPINLVRNDNTHENESCTMGASKQKGVKGYRPSTEKA